MALSEILNIVFGTGLVATIIGILSLRSQLKKARAEAEKAMAEADSVKITNTENATRILVQNIVEPLREELNETRKDLTATKREMARFRKAIEAIPLCPYHAGCPVLYELQDGTDVDAAGRHGQYQGSGKGRNQAGKRDRASPSGHSRGNVNNPGSDRQSPGGGRVQRTDKPGEGNAQEGPERECDTERPGHQPGEGEDRNSCNIRC